MGFQQEKYIKPELPAILPLEKVNANSIPLTGVYLSWECKSYTLENLKFDKHRRGNKKFNMTKKKMWANKNI